jgi:hypothetical protein
VLGGQHHLPVTGDEVEVVKQRVTSTAVEELPRDGEALAALRSWLTSASPSGVGRFQAERNSDLPQSFRNSPIGR